MTKSSRFTKLAGALAHAGEGAQPTDAADAAPAIRPPAVSPHRPAAALSHFTGNLAERIKHLEAQLADGQAELARSTADAADLRRQLDQARSIAAGAGSTIDEFHFIATDAIVDTLPRDRLRGACDGPEFAQLLADIEANGQNDAITVRRTGEGRFEIAAGRRRLEVCRRLGRSVLARIRTLDDGAMLRVQYAENERRTDISALERARWFAAVRDSFPGTIKDVAAEFAVDRSTFSLYLRLARFPDTILNRLVQPQRLAMIPARQVMEAIEADPAVLPRILSALDAYEARVDVVDGADQVAVVVRAAEGRGGGSPTPRRPGADRRHIVRDGKPVATLTRSAGQWVIRFSKAISDDEVQRWAERLADPDLVPRTGL